MVGWFAFSGVRRFSLERTAVQGFPLLRLEAPIPRRTDRADRRAAKGAALLARAGCRRVLAAPDFPYWPQLEEAGLRPVDPGPLCQALAAPLLLAELDRLGIPHRRAAVALWGDRVSRPFFEAACALCPQVRTLTIAAPDGGEDLRRFLREEYGAAALEAGAGPPAHTAAAFSPAPAAEEILRLCGPVPDLGSLALRPAEWEMPEEIETLPLLALLWESGRLNAQGIEIFSTTMRGNPLDSGEQSPYNI